MAATISHWIDNKPFAGDSAIRAGDESGDW